MRPIFRGEWPQDKEGKNIVYSDYANARGELIERIGELCSYCEQHLNSSLAVEHIQPKKPAGVALVDKKRELDWENFLLACVNCNSTKGDKDVVLGDYFWPDKDNTFRAFKYSEGGIVSPADGLSSAEDKRAKKTIKLMGLDKQPENDPAVKDRRWKSRREVWEIAVGIKGDLSATMQRNAEIKPHISCCEATSKLIENEDALRRTIVVAATGHGYWSIWMTVFSDDSDMRKRFIAAFKGTASDCFDENGTPCPRPNGQL